MRFAGNESQRTGSAKAAAGCTQFKEGFAFVHGVLLLTIILACTRFPLCFGWHI
jgi:hypothetical protein